METPWWLTVFPVVLFLSLFVLVPLNIFVIRPMLEKKRIEAWQNLAKELSFSFIGDAPALVRKLQSNNFFLSERFHKAKNTLRGKIEDVDTWITDYQYQTGHKEHELGDNALLISELQPFLALIKLWESSTTSA